MPNIYADLAKKRSTDPRTWNEILDELDSEDDELKEVDGKQIDKNNIEHYRQTIPDWNLHHKNSLEQRQVHPCYVCVAIEPEGYNSVVDCEWEEDESTIDLGATETVIDTNTLTHVKTVEGPAFKRGVKYEVANGVRIPNLGEKSFKGFTEEGTLKDIIA